MIIKNPWVKPLNANHQFIIDKVEGLLTQDELEQFYITSTTRDGDPKTNVHAAGLAIDLSCKNLPLQRKLFDLLKSGGWPGGLGISKVAGNVHVHIDRRDLIPWPAVQFVELDPTGSQVACAPSDAYAKAYEEVRRICG